MEEIGKQQFYIMYLNVYLVAYLWVFLEKPDIEPNAIIVNLWFLGNVYFHINKSYPLEYLTLYRQ